LKRYFSKIKDAGVKTIDITFYGTEEYHDSFAARKGDFDYLLHIAKFAENIDIIIQPTIPIFEDNKEQTPVILEIIRENISESIKPDIFIHDFRGKGVSLENIRLTKSSYNNLPEDVKIYLNISKYKTEQEWIKHNDWIIPQNRHLRLSIRKDNIEMFEEMSCDEIIEHLVDIDEKYYSQIPSVYDLTQNYSDKDNQKLYRQRDLYWKWLRQYIKQNCLKIRDINDEKYCGSFRN
jgi:hypothetical protein